MVPLEAAQQCGLAYEILCLTDPTAWAGSLQNIGRAVLNKVLDGNHLNPVYEALAIEMLKSYHIPLNTHAVVSGILSAAFLDLFKEVGECRYEQEKDTLTDF